MKNSIRVKLFGGISLVIFFFVLFSLFLNTNYLGKYYLLQKTRFLVDTAEEIDNIYTGDPADIYLQLEGLERSSGISLLILDSSYQIKYFSMRGGGPSLRDDHRISMIIGQSAQLEKSGRLLVNTKDPRLHAEFLDLIYLMDNRDILVLSTPLAAIEENAAVANRFFLYTGLLTLAIGAGVSFLFARWFTRPILELNDIAQSMAHLDFSKKYLVDSQDEIGELGNSINSLSDQLHASITELQAANLKLQEDIEKERKIDEMRKEFISNVSHELKTPISLIQGYAEGLKVNVVQDEADKNYYCDVIIDEAMKMDSLVRDLLELSQIESGCFQLEKQEFDLSLLLDQILAKYAPIFKEKGIQPAVDKAEEVMVNADVFRCEQVLVNYINNALNHIDEHKELRVKVVEGGEKVRVSVFNTGPLIPDEELPKIFSSFYKVDKARTRAYGGTGLGLSVVKAIQEMDRNGFGAVNMDNGVEFWFELDRITDG